jgi:carboxyl-terminal processing protease
MHSLLRTSMHLRTRTSTAFIVLVIALGLAAPLGFAQEARRTAVGSEETISSLQVGRQLEAERRWQEAIQYYEKAIRKEASNRELAERLQIARVHLDVVRRYSDRSFLETVRRSNPSDALDVLADVLGKLDLYYVEAIDYSKLALFGTACLEVALTEHDFVEAHVPQASLSKIESFRQTIHHSVLGQRVRNASELRYLVQQIASQAQQQLGLAPSATIYEYVSGCVAMLDPYSAYLTPGEYREIMAQIEGNLIGLGVELWAEGTELRIVDVFRGSPADEAGLKAGHFILEIDGFSVLQVGAKKSADMLRGPEGSRVQLVISNGGEQTATLDVVRKRVEIPSVSIAELRDGSVGYLRITNFQKTTVHEVKRSMFELSRQGMHSLVIDLRHNPGGLLDAAVELADEFLSQGGIVLTRGRNGQENHNFNAHAPGTWDIPLVVLIDGDSASASEIFAGAIRDHNRGYVVGQTSYGKGSVQGVFHNDHGDGGLRLTVSKFYSPNGTAISARGIQPHVVVPEEDLPAAQSLIALRPDLEASSRGVPPSAGAAKPDRTLEKGLQLARELEAR